MNTWDKKIFDTVKLQGWSNQLALIIVAQARFETGEYSSNAFKQNLNAFGYKYYPGSDWQNGKGIQSSEGDNYADYKTVEDSTNELISWIKRRINENKFLLSDLSSTSNYSDKLKLCGYYGGNSLHYSLGLKYQLAKIDLSQFVSEGETKFLLIIIAFYILIFH